MKRLALLGILIGELAAADARADTVKFRGLDLVLVVDHDRATEQEVMDAYGMAVHLGNAGVSVGWWIARDKLYEDFDFTAQTDDAPDPSTPGPDGLVETRSYRAGPFVIQDPVPATEGYNEAWDEILDLEARYGLAPLIHEIRDEPETDRLNIAFLTFLPRVAYSSNAGIAEDEIVSAKIPGVNVPSPGAADLPATVAGGGLFEGDAGGVCGRRPRFDVYMQDHYDYDPDLPEHALAAGEYDDFLRMGTTCIFECLSATIDNRVHWLTEAGNVAVEGAATAGFYTVVPDFADHPFAQTMGTIPERGGAFQLWDADANAFNVGAEYIFTDEVSGDVGYMLGQVEGGKFFFAGGHQRGGVEDHRIILNALVYEIVSPQFWHTFHPPYFTLGASERRQVRIHVRGGTLAQNVVIVDTLEDVASFITGSVRFRSTGPTYTWDSTARTLAFEFGDVDPDLYPDGIIATYDVETLLDEVGEVQILSSGASYDDPWTTGITFSGSVCESAEIRPELWVEVTSSAPHLAVGGSDVTLFVSVANMGTDVLGSVTLSDTLPPSVTYVGSIDTLGRGRADWDVTAPATLTWEAGWLVPGEGHTMSFTVHAEVPAGADFLLDDGPSATALGSGGATLSEVGPDLVLPVVTADTFAAVFSLDPPAVITDGDRTLTFSMLNTGPASTFTDTSVAEIRFPDTWGSPRDIVPGAGWQYFWYASDRILSFARSGGNLGWNRDATISFTFTARSPALPEFSAFGARATSEAGGVPILHEGDARVAVVSTMDTDTDGDSISDADELVAGSDPLDPDTDGDGIPDGYEIGPDPSDPIDTDGDGTPDFLDLDSDGDGLADSSELVGDPDEDGIPNFRDTDSDSDGLSDSDESDLGTDPYDTDTDRDGLDDLTETLIGTDPLNPDSDCDGTSDGEEVEAGTDPLGEPGCGPDGADEMEPSADADEDGDAGEGGRAKGGCGCTFVS